MRKKDLANQVIAKLQKQDADLKRKDVIRIINMFLDILEDSILSKEHEKIQLSGFGTFYVRERKPRVGRNPKTGDLYQIPYRYSLVFKPSQNFVLQVNHRKKP